MPEELHTCPTCDTPNFTAKGLRAHRCKGIKRGAGGSPAAALPSTISHPPSAKPIDGKAEVTTDHPDDLENEDPRWKTLRETLKAFNDIGRSLVECKAWIGWQLACLKKDHGVARGKIGNGRPAESRSADSADLLTWPEILKAKTGLERRTADEMIRIFEATQAKLKRLKAPESKAALAIFRSGNPLSVPPEQREHLRDIVASVCTGHTVGSMLEELGVVPRPVAPKQTAEKTKGEEPTAGQLAFHFFEPLAAELLRHRSSADFDKLVIALPLHPDEDNPVALSTIEADLRAILEKVESAKAAHAKPAKAGGSVVR